MNMSESNFMSEQERRFAERMSRLATCDPFLPERVELERETLGSDFEPYSTVWSKQVRLERFNPNVRKLADRTESLAKTLRERLPRGKGPTESEAELYEDLVSYLLYYRYEEELEKAMTAKGRAQSTSVHATCFR